MDLFPILNKLADKKHDGHWTIFKFTTGYKCMLETPDFGSGKGREEIKRISSKPTLTEAIIDCILRELNEMTDKLLSDCSDYKE